ncbi:MAG: LUD domain-containing protein [Gaiellaceae bacterium]
MSELFVERAREAGCTVLEDGCAGIEADYGIAETGSLVFIAGRGRTRASWIDLEVLDVELQEDRIVRDLEDLFALLKPNLPSAVAIVTGPSRTADIEQTLVVGVHGPREVRVRLRGRS